MNEELQEYVDSRGLAIQTDRDRGVIRGVKILGARSRNGRTYLAQAMNQAVPLYEGAKVNVNHAKAAPSGPRDYQDRIGVIRNVTARADEGSSETSTSTPNMPWLNNSSGTPNTPPKTSASRTTCKPERRDGETQPSSKPSSRSRASTSLPTRPPPKGCSNQQTRRPKPYRRPLVPTRRS